MTDCNFQHFDFELSKKILSLLKVMHLILINVCICGEIFKINKNILISIAYHGLRF